MKTPILASASFGLGGSRRERIAQSRLQATRPTCVTIDRHTSLRI